MGRNGAEAIRPLVAMILILLTATLVVAQEPTADDAGPPPSSGWAERVPRLSGWGEYVPRAGIGYETGRGIGYPNGYGRVEGMIPLLEDSGRLLLFSDLRLLIDNDAQTGSNLGFGCRYYAPRLDRTFGAAVYYDLRETDVNMFEQLTFSFDTLGRWWDLHTNVYCPSIFSDRRVEPTHFAGNYLFLEGVETAISGMDMEVSVPLPSWWRVDPRLGAGWYHFQGDDVPDLWGWKIHTEARVAENIVLDLAVHHDEQFHTTVNFGATLWFPNTWSQRPGTSSGRREPSQRLGEPVQRLENIAVVSRPSEPARDPQTGDPLVFLHVSSEPGQSGGSFETPYHSLADALNDPRYQNGAVDVVYVRSSPESPLSHVGDVALVSGVQLRSNGPVQSVNTQRGSTRLPFSGVDSTLRSSPQIKGNVVLADNTCLSGFSIQGTVLGSNVSNITIADNWITDFDKDFPVAVWLSRVAGTVAIHDNLVDMCWGSLGGIGIYVDQSRSAVMTVAENRLTACSNAIVVYGGAVTADIVGNTINGNETGIRIMSGGFTGRIADNRIHGNVQHGILLDSVNFTGEIRRNTISGNGSFGVCGSFPDGRFNGSIAENVISGNQATGISFKFGSADGNHRIAVLNNQFADNGQGMLAKDVWISQEPNFNRDTGSSAALYVEFDGNASDDIPVQSGCSNYVFARFMPPWPSSVRSWWSPPLPSTPYLTPGPYFLHLGRNAGTINSQFSGISPAAWSTWPDWPE